MRDVEALRREGCGRVDQLLLGAPGDRDDRTVAGERTRGPEPDAGTATDDDGALAGERSSSVHRRSYALGGFTARVSVQSTRRRRWANFHAPSASRR